MDPTTKFKIDKVAHTFMPPREGYRSLAWQIADTVNRAHLPRFVYSQDGQEMRADYLEYVYDNSFARRRRRNRY